MEDTSAEQDALAAGLQRRQEPGLRWQNSIRERTMMSLLAQVHGARRGCVGEQSLAAHGGEWNAAAMKASAKRSSSAFHTRRLVD